MTPPPAPTRTVDGTHVRRRNWAGEPTLLLGEDARGYDELLAQVSRVLVPRDVIEDMWIRDVVDLAWDVLRLRRLNKSAARTLAAARAAASPGSGETIPNGTSDNEIDIAAVLRRPSRKPPAFGLRVGKERVGPVSILSANEAKFRERSQRAKTQQKQSCKMNDGPIGCKNCSARPE